MWSEWRLLRGVRHDSGDARELSGVTVGRPDFDPVIDVGSGALGQFCDLEQHAASMPVSQWQTRPASDLSSDTFVLPPLPTRRS